LGFGGIVPLKISSKKFKRRKELNVMMEKTMPIAAIPFAQTQINVDKV